MTKLPFLALLLGALIYSELCLSAILTMVLKIFPLAIEYLLKPSDSLPQTSSHTLFATILGLSVA